MIGDFLAAAYPWTKSLHVMSVLAWMAGLFYLPRLFVYHAEQVGQGNDTDQLFQTMEYKLLRVIMNPAMIATWIFGLAVALSSNGTRVVGSAPFTTFNGFVSSVGQVHIFDLDVDEQP